MYNVKIKIIHFNEVMLWLINSLFCICVKLTDFYEERAILLGRLGNHEQALAIYTNHVKDTAKAEELVVIFLL